MDSLDRAIEIVGGLTALAARIKTTPQVIVHWRNRGVPPQRCRDIEVATDGQVSREDLRPDIFGKATA